MTIIRLVFIFSLLSDFSSYASVPSLGGDFANGMTRLGTAFARVMTKGCENFVPLKFEHHRAFMNKHWLDRWEVKKAEFSKCNHTLVIGQDGPIGQFHRLLSERLITRDGKLTEEFVIPIEERQDSKKEEKLNTRSKEKLHKKLKVPKFNDISSTEYESASECFLEGHEIEFIDVELDSPMVAVNMYRDSDVADIKGNYQSRAWWMPIEQVFWYPTLGQYRNAASLLKIWGPYSNLVVSVFPKGTLMTFKAGLLAPKIFPIPLDHNVRDFDNSITKRIKDNRAFDLGARIAFNLAGFEEDPQDHVTEFLKGGALQFYVQYAECASKAEEPVPVFNFGRIIESDVQEVFQSKKMYLQTSIPRKGERSTWNSDLVYRESVFAVGNELERKNFYLHKSSPYDKSRIGLVAALRDAEVITPREAEEFNAVIEKVVLESYRRS